MVSFCVQMIYMTCKSNGFEFQLCTHLHEINFFAFYYVYPSIIKECPLISMHLLIFVSTAFHLNTLKYAFLGFVIIMFNMIN